MELVGNPKIDPEHTGEIICKVYITCGVGTPLDAPGGAGKHCWGDGRVDYQCNSA